MHGRKLALSDIEKRGDCMRGPRISAWICAHGKTWEFVTFVSLAAGNYRTGLHRRPVAAFCLAGLNIGSIKGGAAID